MALGIAAALGRPGLGALAGTLRQKRAARLRHAAPGSTPAIEPTIPAALSPASMRTPRGPRDLSHERCFTSIGFEPLGTPVCFVKLF